jgi:hypothetical protein
MSEIDKRFLDGDGVDAALIVLNDAIAAAVQNIGGTGVKSFVVIAITDKGTGVVTDGCLCPACQVEAMKAFAEANGALVTETRAGLDAEPCPAERVH